MDGDRYRELRETWSIFTRLGIEIFERSRGIVDGDPRKERGLPLFAKIISHATVQLKILPVDAEEATWAPSSIVTLGRAFIETYDALAYISLPETDDVERDFRIQVWNLHALEHRYKLGQSLAAQEEGRRSLADAYAAQYVTTVNHPFFPKAQSKVRERISSKNAPAFINTKSERRAEAGISSSRRAHAEMFMSQDVHSLPMSTTDADQLLPSQAKAIRKVQVALDYSLPYFSRSLIGFHWLMFGRQIQASTDTLTKLMVWNGVAESDLSPQ